MSVALYAFAVVGACSTVVVLLFACYVLVDGVRDRARRRRVDELCRAAVGDVDEEWAVFDAMRRAGGGSL